MGRSFEDRRDQRPEGFSSGWQGDGTFFKVEQSAAPDLYALAERFPKAFTRALKSVGNSLRGQMRAAMRNGGPVGYTWPKISQMHTYRRMDLLKAGGVGQDGQWTHGRRFALKARVGQSTYQLGQKEIDRLGAQGSYSYLRGKRRGLSYTAGGRMRGQQSIPQAFSRWRGRRRDGDLRNGNMGGNLQKALRYKMVNDKRVDIGAVSPSAAAYLAALQAGRRGARGRFEYQGRQPVTPAMRRAFWAAGVPLAADTRELVQQPRPLVLPVYQQWSPRLEAYIIGKIEAYLNP